MMIMLFLKNLFNFAVEIIPNNILIHYFMENQIIECDNLIDSLNQMISDLKRIRFSYFGFVNWAFYAYIVVAENALNWAKSHVCEVG